MKARSWFKTWCTRQLKRLKGPVARKRVTCVLWVFSVVFWVVYTLAGLWFAADVAELGAYIVLFLWIVVALVSFYATDRFERASVIQKIMFWQAGMSVTAMGLDLQFRAIAKDPNSPPFAEDPILNTAFFWLFGAISALFLELVKLLEKQSGERQES